LDTQPGLPFGLTAIFKQGKQAGYAQLYIFNSAEANKMA
jgi:hypothetical protein